MNLPDLFPGFAERTFHLPGVDIFARIGGDEQAPPLVLLHGFPQTHAMWAGIAGELAKTHRVIVPDLRGYGFSGVVERSPDHAQMSKRAMAGDIVALMRELGYERFAVAGHDRGGRVAYRLALDSPECVTRLAVLDIVPTSAMWASMTAAFAMKVYHWQFLAQPYPMPETVISGAPVGYLEHTLASWTARRDLSAFSADALEHYRAAFSQADRISASCEDYRAGWYVDRLLDEADQANGVRIQCPTLVLWGNAGLPADSVDAESTPLSVWKSWATNVSGQPIAAGHFIVEENSAETLAALKVFFAD